MKSRMFMQQENASAATQKVKEGVSSFLGGISKALVIAPDDDYQLAQIVGGQAVVFDRYKVASMYYWWSTGPDLLGAQVALALIFCYNYFTINHFVITLSICYYDFITAKYIFTIAALLSYLNMLSIIFIH